MKQKRSRKESERGLLHGALETRKLKIGLGLTLVTGNIQKLTLTPERKDRRKD